MKDRILEKTIEAEEIMHPFFKVGRMGASQLGESVEYSLVAGGKRLRPIMMREAALLFGEEPESLAAFMAALEMIHNYSLVHDDLPALDNDMLRHGKPSTHAKYGEANAILCGDALLNLAYETIIFAIKKNPEPEVINAANCLAKAAGMMVAGQALDVKYEKIGGIPSKDDLTYIYENKTGMLIRAALSVGGELSGAAEDDLKKLDKIGANIGFAFQIVDDILDVEGDEDIIGKPVGSDEKNGKYTFLNAMGMEASEKRVDELTDEAIEILMTLPGDKSFLNDLFIYLTDRTM